MKGKLLIIIAITSNSAFSQTHQKANYLDSDTWFTSSAVSSELGKRTTMAIGVENFGFWRNSLTYNSLDRKTSSYIRGEGFGADTKIVFKSPIVNIGLGGGLYNSKWLIPNENDMVINDVRTTYQELSLDRYIFESVMLSFNVRASKDQVPEQPVSDKFTGVGLSVTLFGDRQ